MSAQSADAASYHFTSVGLHGLILRASRELEADRVLKREVLLNLMRSLHEDRSEFETSR